MNMKHGLYLLMFLLCGTGLQAQDRVVEQPAFDAWSSTTLEIDKIALSDTATVFYIDAYFRPKYWIQVVKETTLRADGKTYPIKTGDGITLREKFWMPESGEASFRLIFPPLPKGTKTVDFIEGDEEGAFKIWGIHLDGSPANSSLAGKKNPKEDPVLEKPEFKNGLGILKGHIAGYKPEMGLKGRAWVSNILTDSNDEYDITVQSDGNFKLEIPLYYLTSLNITSGFMNGQIYLKPGETTSVEINFPEICRAQSKKQKDKPSLGEKYYFTGAMAALNNEACNSSLRFVSLTPKTQEEYMQMFSDISSMNADQFKAYWMDRYQKEKAALDSHTELSDAYRTLLQNSLKKDLAEQLLSITGMTEYAYRTANQIPRDSVIPKDKKVIPGIEYYDFLPELVCNDTYLLYDGSFTYLISYIQYANFTGEERTDKDNIPDNTAELAKLMGTDKGTLFDLLAAQRLSKPIKEFHPLSDEQIAQAGKISPVFQEAFVLMNNKVKQTIEENKKKSGYTVNRVNIADIPAEELFNAITTPYRGKVVFVDFWATWCGPCKAAMKQSEPVKKDFAGKEIVFLYLAGENSPKGTWEQMIPDIKGEHYRMTDAQWDFICKKFGVNGVPSYMIIAKDGTPTHFQVGFMGAEKMKEMLNKELEK
jgi:thiol-disulfide isomerase/thioredoxin